MAKRILVLVRHAKATKAGSRLISLRPILRDADRPLTERGKTDARRMAKRLARRGFRPDMIWASPARRTLATARAFAKKLDYRRKDIRVDPQLYASTADALLQRIHGLKRKRSHVLLCGHNPELLRLAQKLGSKVTELPTCAVLQLEFDAKAWASAGPATLIAAQLDLPKRNRGDPS